MVESMRTAAHSTGLRHRVADHAASGAMRDLLEHHRLSYAPEPLSEGAVFGLSGALDLRMRMAANGVPVIDLQGRASSLETDLCRHLGINAELYTTDDAQAGRQALQAELDAGNPTLVRADLRALDYREDERHDTRHAIVVAGYDNDAGVACVADQGFAEPQHCSLAALARSRASPWGAEPVRHAMLALRPRRQLADPRDATAAALRRVIATMRGSGKLPTFPNVHSGLDGIDALAGGWSLLPEMAGSRLGETLAALRFRIGGSGTGGALYRSLQARFLHEAAPPSARRSSVAARSSATTSPMPGVRWREPSPSATPSSHIASRVPGCGAFRCSSTDTSRRSRPISRPAGKRSATAQQTTFAPALS